MSGVAAPPPPAGYRRLAQRGTELVAREDVAHELWEILTGAGSWPRTLHDFAACSPDARSLVGRGPSYAIALPRSATRVVVRHNRHGGVLAPITGDRFLNPTNAPHELDVALRLQVANVPTVDVLAYAVYGTDFLRRADVVSAELAPSRDLGEILRSGSGDERKRSLEATALLLNQLAAAGARHADLNVKNILIHEPPRGFVSAHVLDVDRVRFTGATRETIEDANFRRLARSARKSRRLHGARIDDAEIDWLCARAREIAR